MNAAPEHLDRTRVLAALAEITKADPDGAPVHHCNGASLDVEVPDRSTAGKLARILDGIHALHATPAYETGWAGTIASCPVRVLVTRTRRGRGWAA